MNFCFSGNNSQECDCRVRDVLSFKGADILPAAVAPCSTCHLGERQLPPRHPPQDSGSGLHFCFVLRDMGQVFCRMPLIWGHVVFFSLIFIFAVLMDVRWLHLGVQVHPLVAGGAAHFP